jgi:hypothetical protein
LCAAKPATDTARVGADSRIGKGGGPIKRRADKKPLRLTGVLLILFLLFLAACASIEDVKQGTGKSLTIKGRSYDEVWQAAHRVAVEHFEILEQDQARGIIRGERQFHFMGEGGDWVGIFITPPAPGTEAYLVEGVKRRKLRTQVSGQDWEKKVLRDLRDVLDGKPMR